MAECFHQHSWWLEHSLFHTGFCLASLSAAVHFDLVSQARPTSAREERGSGEQRIQAVSRRTVQSDCSILPHDALHHCLSSNSCLENGEHELGHLFRYCRSCKSTSTLLLGERAYSATGNSKVHYLKSGYVIQLIAFRWDTACIRSSPDPSLLLRKWVGLA